MLNLRVVQAIRKIDEQESEKPVLTVSNFKADEQCSLGGPTDRCWLCNHAGQNCIPKANKHDIGGTILSPSQPETS